MGAQFFQSFVWNATVNIDQGDGLAVDCLASQVHAGDIDLRLAKDLADKADDAGAIFIEQHQDMAVGEELPRYSR